MHQKAPTLLNQRGALPLVIALSAVLLIVGAAILTAIVSLNHQIQNNHARLETRSLEDQIMLAFATGTVCTCHMKAPDNPAATWTINTSVATPPGFELPEIRSGCDFTSGQNLLATTSSSSSSGASVDAIRVTNVKPLGGDLYSAHLIVVTKTPAGTMPIAPEPLHFQFAVDSSAGPGPSPIKNCLSLSHAGTFDTCPAGYTLIGTPGNFRNVCIENSPRPAKTYVEAQAVCANEHPSGFPWASLCSVQKWMDACDRGLAGVGSSEDWVLADVFTAVLTPGVADESGYATALGGSGCSSGKSYVNTTTKGFRCCIYSW